MISNKCYYGLKAILELAVREGAGPVPIGEIAESQAIPVRFLESILRQLKQSGYAESARGKEGGYFLARPSKEITVGQVIRLFEGSLIAVNAIAAASRDGAVATDVFNALWSEADAVVNHVFDGVTFDQLASKERLRSHGLAENYTI